MAISERLIELAREVSRAGDNCQTDERREAFYKIAAAILKASAVATEKGM